VSADLLCLTTVQYHTEQFWSSSFLSSRDNHHWTDVVYRREGVDKKQVSNAPIISGRGTVADDDDVGFLAVELRCTFCSLQVVSKLRRLATDVTLFRTRTANMLRMLT